MKKRLLIAGGGTGGHIAPAQAVGAKALSSFDVCYACTPREVDRIMYADVKEPVFVMNPPRIDKGMKLLLPVTLTVSLIKALRLLKRERIDVVLGTGGYSSFFTIAASWLIGKPAALFESNAIPGKSNRIASRFCRRAFTGLPGGESGLKGTVCQTGTPVSADFRKIPADQARIHLGLPGDKPVVLFLGGSQGASAINDMAANLASEGDLSVLLQSGNRDYERIREKTALLGNIVVEPFLSDLSMWYSAAELAVARAGGQTIAELSAFAIPAVLVPFPYAAEDHQTANAAVVEMAGAAVLTHQEGTTSGEMSELLLRLISSDEKLSAMGEAMKTLFPSDPAGEIVANLKEMVK